MLLFKHGLKSVSKLGERFSYQKSLDNLSVLFERERELVKESGGVLLCLRA